MNADGTGPTRLTTSTATDNDPSFNGAGTRITFTSDRTNSRREIYVMNADGTGQTRLTNVAGNITPSFSPDGTKITFISSRNGGQQNVYIMNADGTNRCFSQLIKDLAIPQTTRHLTTTEPELPLTVTGAASARQTMIFSR